MEEQLLHPLVDPGDRLLLASPGGLPVALLSLHTTALGSLWSRSSKKGRNGFHAFMEWLPCRTDLFLDIVADSPFEREQRRVGWQEER